MLVQSLSHVQLFETPWTAVHQASLSFTISRSLLKLKSIESVMLFNHLILCCPPVLLSVFPNTGVFSSELALCIRRTKLQLWSFIIGASASASVVPMNTQGWFTLALTDLLAVQRTLKSLLQHHSSKASILWHSAFFMVQLSHPYMTTGKTIALTRRNFVGKAMSLLFNMLPRLAIAFLPSSNCLLISWLQSPSSVILEPKKIKSVPVSIFLLAMKWCDQTPAFIMKDLSKENLGGFWPHLYVSNSGYWI